MFILLARSGARTFVGFAVLATAMTTDAAYRATLHEAMVSLGNVKIGGQLHTPSVHPLRILHRVDRAILTWLESAKTWSEGFVVDSLVALTESLALMVGVPLAIALSLWMAIKALAARIDHYVVQPVNTTVIRTVSKTVTVVDAKATARWKALTHRVDVLRAQVAHAVAVGAGAIARPFPRIGALERTAKAQAGRLTRLEKVALGGVAVGAVWLALRRLGLGFLRCTNVKRTGRAVCGMDPSLLNALLLEAAVLGFAFNIREFTQAMQAVTGELADVIVDLTGGDEATQGTATPR